MPAVMSVFFELSALVRCSVVGVVVEHSPDIEIMDDDHVVCFAIWPRHYNTILVVLREDIPDPGLDLPVNHQAVRFFTRPEDDMIAQFQGD
jgi:hypothetical protein